MDLICLILWIIDCFKPSIILSIFVIVTGFIDIVGLILRGSEFNLAYAISMAGIIIGVVIICRI